MARTIQELNVVLGTDLKKYQDGLKKAESALQRSGARLAQRANEIGLAISLPLGLAGVGALKAAADFDALRNAITTAMTSAGRSVEDATKEIAALRKESLRPGLNFEQLLQGSVKLQAVGISAEKARGLILSFGNALALAGGTADDLSGVNLAITQIVSKGKVFAEEINQIAERVPQVRKAMIDAFGTARTEDIQKLNLTSEQFLEIIQKQLDKLPQAPDSMANAFKNASQEIKLAAIEIGGAIEKNFNISGKVSAFAGAVKGAIESFAGLNTGVQKAILYFGGFLIALAPVLKVMAAIKLLNAQLITGYSAMLGGLRNLASGLIGAANAFKALSLAQKLTVVGLVASAITGLVYAYQNYTEKLTVAERVERSMNKTREAGLDAISQEKVTAEKLVDVLKSDVSTREDKIKALNQLRSISPEYFGGLKLDKELTEKATGALNAYIKTLTQKAVVQQSIARLGEIEVALGSATKLAEGAEPTFLQSLANGFKSIGNPAMQAALEVKTLTDNINENRQALVKEREELNKLIGSNQQAFLDNTGAPKFDATKAGERDKKRQQIEIEILPSLASTGTDAFKDFEDSLVELIRNNPGKTLQEATSDFLSRAFSDAGKNLQLPELNIQTNTEAWERYRATIEEATAKQVVFGTSYDFLNEKIGATGQLISALLENGVSPYNESIVLLMEQLRTFQAEQQKVNETLEFSQEITGQLAPIFQNMFETFLTGGKAFDEIKKQLGALIIKLAAAAAAAAILNALLPGSGGFKAGFGNIFKSLTGFKLPGFAGGVSNFGGGLAMVGERGAELVNLPRGSDVIPNHRLGTMFGEQKVIVDGVFRIKGTDLELVLADAQRQRTRLNGR